MKVVGKIFAVLFCILYFFILTALIFSASALNLLSGNYYTNIIESVDLDSIKISDFKDSFTNMEFEEDASIEDVIVSYFAEGGISEDITLGVINNKKVRQVAGKLIGQYVNFNVTGEKPVIEKDEFEEIFEEEDVKKLLKEITDDQEIDIDSLYEQLNDLIDEMVEGGNNGYDNSKSNSINTEIN